MYNRITSTYRKVTLRNSEKKTRERVPKPITSKILALGQCWILNNTPNPIEEAPMAKDEKTIVFISFGSFELHARLLLQQIF